VELAWRTHARERLEERDISERLVRETVREPEQVWGRGAHKVLQRRYLDATSKKEYLLRVFAGVCRDPGRGDGHPNRLSDVEDQEVLEACMIEVTYDAKADALYFRLRDTKIDESDEVSDGVIVDYDRGQAGWHRSPGRVTARWRLRPSPNSPHAC
jgi:hypothetical protein